MADTEEENLQSQIDEIEALSSIYGDDWCVIDEAARIFCIQISNSLDQPEWTLCLQVILPPEYPATAPPLYQLKQNLGDNILYQWVEKIREFLVEKSKTSHPGPTLKAATEETEAADDDDEIASSSELLNNLFANLAVFGHLDAFEDTEKEVPKIEHGETISDRRSTFQAHLAPVTSPAQVKQVLNKLYENKKIASATHNIYSYRIYSKKTNSFIQDCEDDGETAAGKRLLHLMQILDVKDVMVVVSRWYGGILLGPDRFKHINNCARNILVEHNYSSSADESSKHSKNKSNSKEGKKRTEH
ncbi:protein IMPACT isoform X2 [Rana temporaria]|uniref:protein IMPACT isoform X2 n=1 Tax=Rana temporaria TaxID=8407 RepID=UPI001AAC95F6|nr:protein IMPACT isoform X2 [Rana temporaria]